MPGSNVIPSDRADAPLRASDLLDPQRGRGGDRPGSCRASIGVVPAWAAARRSPSGAARRRRSRSPRPPGCPPPPAPAPARCGAPDRSRSARGGSGTRAPLRSTPFSARTPGGAALGVARVRQLRGIEVPAAAELPTGCARRAPSSSAQSTSAIALGRLPPRRPPRPEDAERAHHARGRRRASPRRDRVEVRPDRQRGPGLPVQAGPGVARLVDLVGQPDLAEQLAERSRACRHPSPQQGRRRRLVAGPPL